MKEINTLSNKLTIFCSKVEDGNMSYKFGVKEQVAQNIQEYLKKINILQEKTYNLKILNSDKIRHLTRDNITNEIEADAVIITEPDIYIYLAFGDCIPFIAYDEKKKILGYAHLGWRSICVKLHNKLINEMVKNYECDIEDIKIIFGPSVSASSYAFPNPAQKDMSDWKNYVFLKESLYYIDLEGYIINDIKMLGIVEENINRNIIDTASDDEFFSHYRSMHNKEVEEGRFIFGAGVAI